ncbi:sensor histidine kinase [Shouchella clausii]|uniref:sensor histidine kinase n=1 Tax=Shouchella clausii TaxID=79880 RepID=UPI00211C37BA|nr:HAMP domain-containing sensor histidine kinase [Shouchella clausii]MEB5480083.1 HAMP domain-containing sensor histidine kinase [Shouchella clausii]
MCKLSQNQKAAPIGSNQVRQMAKSVDVHDDHLLYIKEPPDVAHSMFSFIKAMDIPYLKVDECFRQLHWSESFVHLTDLAEKDLEEQTLAELGVSDHLLHFINEQLSISVGRGNQIVKNCYEDDDATIKVTVFPERGTYAFVYYVLLEDLTVKRKFEELVTFQHQMQAVSHIAASVAHELRNPLSVIKGFLQLSHLTSDFQKYYNTIISELNRMNVIIEDFLSVSRKKNDRKWQSPAQLLQSLAELMRAECSLHSVEFQLDIEETFAICHVNESMFKQVMLNLLRNSIEAYEEQSTGRRLEIRSREVGEQVIIELIDNGKGMPDTVLSQLGKPFFTTKEKGTGVGIPLCKKIIEDHGGTFYIQSEANVGTRIEMVLPLLV